jgi:cell division protein ZapB
MQPSEDSATEPTERLEAAITQLLEAHAALREENLLLREQVRQLKSERAAFKERNEQARHRVENMIARLRSMEHSE